MKQKLLHLYHALPIWAKGLLVAAEGGAIGFLVQWASNPQPLCFTRQCVRQFGGAFLGAVIAAVRNWLKQSPLAKNS